MEKRAPATGRRRRLAAFCLLFPLFPAILFAQTRKLNPYLRAIQQSSPAQLSLYRPAGVDLEAPEPTVKLLLRLAPGVSKSLIAAKYPKGRFGALLGRILRRLKVVCGNGR